MTKVKQAAIITLMDMIYDAYHGTSEINPPKTGLTQRVLYSAVRRIFEPLEFEMVLEQLITGNKARFDGKHWRWIEN